LPPGANQKKDMQNIVTVDTAKRLKDAGFPQKADLFDFWYCVRNNMLAICNGVDKYTGVFVYPLQELKINEDLFAPTSADILRELGGQFSLTYEEDGLYNDVFYIEKTTSYDVIEVESNENPAEAAALAWLSIHENPCQK